MSEPFYLAMDAGGTRTTYVLASEDRVLARVESGTVKRMRTTAEIATENFRSALRELESISGVPMQRVVSTCIGAAGVTVPLVTDWMRETHALHVGGTLLILGDVDIALDAAFPGEPGMLVMAGTGSNTAARSSNGAVTTAGGYGPILSDQGSGHHIGTRALRSCFLAQDEGRPNNLMGAILSHWRLAVPDDLVGYAHACPLSEISALTPVVLRCAEQGDALAGEVLAKEGEELAYLALLLHRRMLLADGDAWVPKVAFAGSILQHVHPLREALLRSLRAEIPLLYDAPGVVDPVMGALWRARHHVSPAARA
ncbi:MAG: N-acetylglucosamine kinase [Janthinobacterium lividum]